MIDHEEDAEHWIHPNEKTIYSIYHDLIKKDPVHFSESLYKKSELTPRDGYRIGCDLFKENKDCKRLGIISHDSLFTNGMISAIFQNERRLWDDVFLVSQANKGAYLSDFPVPLITFSADIARECELIFELIQEYRTTKQHPSGARIVPVDFFTPLD